MHTEVRNYMDNTQVDIRKGLFRDVLLQGRTQSVSLDFLFFIFNVQNIYVPIISYVHVNDKVPVICQTLAFPY